MKSTEVFKTAKTKAVEFVTYQLIAFWFYPYNFHALIRS
jgi:hypothetical protein